MCLSCVEPIGSINEGATLESTPEVQPGLNGGESLGKLLVS